jgi:hypothetical protein
MQERMQLEAIHIEISSPLFAWIELHIHTLRRVIRDVSALTDIEHLQ